MNKMREMRKKKGLTMKKLGEIVGVSESTISLYETGKHEPDFVTLKRIADVLEVSVDELLGRESTEPEDDWFISEKSDDTIRLFARGMSKMSPENRERLLEVAKVMFKEDFGE